METIQYNLRLLPLLPFMGAALLLLFGRKWSRDFATGIATAAIGGFAFSFVGGLGAALALGSRRGGLIIAMIVLPLISPPVIFGGGALDALAAGLDWRTGLLLLTAYALAAAALAPFAMAAACRNALS